MADSTVTSTPRRRTGSTVSLANLPAEFREMRREYRADYEGANPNNRFVRRRKGLYGSADAHYASPQKFYGLIETCRDMDRNDAIFQMLVDRAITNTIRGGFELEPDTGDTAANEYLYAKHQAWANDPQQCDEAGEHTLSELAEQGFRSEMVDGDILLHMPPEDSRVQFFEADELRSPKGKANDPNFVHGVELGQNRRRKTYWVVKPGTSLSRGRYFTDEQLQQIPAYNSDNTRRVQHLFHAGRPKQTRGVPLLHAVITKSGQYEDTDFAMLVKLQMAASLAWEEQDTGVGPENAGQPGGYGAKTGETTDEDGNKQRYEEIAPGSVVRLGPGKKLMMHSPQIVSNESIAHLKLTLQTITCAAGVPLCVLLLDGSETNFSGWRGALDQAKLGWQMNQNRWEYRFYRPLNVRNILRWIKDDSKVAEFYAKLGARIFGHAWHKPRWPYTNPLQDAQSDLMQVEGYLDDAYAIAANRGRDGDTIIEQNVKFNGRAIEASIKEAERLNATYPNAKVMWRDVLNRTLPKGGQMVDLTEKANAADDAVTTPAGR